MYLKKSHPNRLPLDYQVRGPQATLYLGKDRTPVLLDTADLPELHRVYDDGWSPYVHRKPGRDPRVNLRSWRERCTIELAKAILGASASQWVEHSGGWNDLRRDSLKVHTYSHRVTTSKLEPSLAEESAGGQPARRGLCDSVDYSADQRVRALDQMLGSCTRRSFTGFARAQSPETIPEAGMIQTRIETIDGLSKS